MRNDPTLRGPLLTAWWWSDAIGKWLHVRELRDDPELRKALPVLDQLALELELTDELA